MGNIVGHENVNVFLYFWDERDGEDLVGWYFGNKVGGEQVWSRNSETGLQPPRSGWTIPWDGPVNNDLVVAPASERAAQQTQAAQARLSARKAEETQKSAAEWEERVQKMTERAADAELSIEEALEEVREALKESEEPEALAMAESTLSAQGAELAKVRKEIAMERMAANKVAPPALKAEIEQLHQRLGSLQEKLTGELKGMKTRREVKKQEEEDAERQAEEDSREQELEGTHMAQWEEIRPSAMDKVQTAEDEVEQVAIAAAPLQIETADDLRSVMLEAINETEKRVRAASTAISDARRFISSKFTTVSSFVKSVKQAAVEEFTDFKKKLEEAEQRLKPFKSVRQDYQQRVEAKKLYEELSAKLVGAEIEVEKAAMLTAPLGVESADSIKETETALSMAQAALAQTTRQVDLKLRTAEKNPGPVKDEILPLKERCKQAQEKLDEVKRSLKETQIRIAADSLLREVSEKVNLAEDELQRMSEAELPFLRGDQKDICAADTIAAAESVATKVQATLGEASAFVAKKLVEVARFQEGPGQSVKEEVDAMRKRLEEGRDRLKQFKVSLADRKRSHLNEEVEAKIATAEGAVEKLKEVSQGLTSAGGAGEPLTEGLKDTLEQARQAERAAQGAALEARKILLTTTGELKKLALESANAGCPLPPGGSELGRLQTRLNALQQEILKLKSGAKEVEERVMAKQQLQEVASRLKSVEAEVSMTCSPEDLGERPTPEAVDLAEKAVASSKAKVAALTKVVDVKLKTAQGFAKDELQAIKGRISQAERKLGQISAAQREQREKLRASQLTAQAAELVETARAAVQQAQDAELPFLKGIEALTPADALVAVGACETAASAAQQAIKDARTQLVQRLAEAKKFSEGPSESSTKQLLALQKRLDADASRLADCKKDTAERKRKSMMQASVERIAGVEQAVKRLADEVAKFDGESSKEEAAAACATISEADRSASEAVTDAKKFLAQRVQETKTYSESVRGPVTAELVRLQQKLTQCVVEQKKLSAQVKEREHRFVARALLQECEEILDTLRKDMESCSQVAAPLLQDDLSAFMGAAHLQILVGCLQANLAATGRGAADAFAAMSSGAPATAADFSRFVQSLPELGEDAEMALSPEQVSAAFALVVGAEGKLTAARFRSLLEDRCVCVARALTFDAPDCGTELGSVEVDEGVELLEPKSDEDGNRWARCTLLRDASTAWLVHTGSDGTLGFKASTSSGQLESICAHIKATHQRFTETCQGIAEQEVKLAGQQEAKAGPLAEAKAKLKEFREKLGHELSRCAQLQRQVSQAASKVDAEVKQEMQRLLKSRWTGIGEKAVAEASAVVEQAEVQANSFLERAQGASPAGPAADSIMTEQETVARALHAAKESVAQSMAVRETKKSAIKSAMLESHLALQKLKVRLESLEKKCEDAVQTVRAARKKAANEGLKQVRAALQGEVQSSGRGLSQIFDELRAGAPEVSLARFEAFVAGLPGLDNGKELAATVYRHIAPHGLRKLGFMWNFEEYMRAQVGVPMADSQDAEAAATLRMMDKNEVLEVLGYAPLSGSTVRARGRAMKTGSEGWVTVKDGEKDLLKSSAKPCVAVIAADVELLSDDRNSTVRKLRKDEVLELLEGPRQERRPPLLRQRARTSLDGVEGWLTLRDAEGKEASEVSDRYWVCRKRVAMTNNVELKEGKAIRKVEEGDVLECIDDDAGSLSAAGGVKRLRFRALSDGIEGWITPFGAKGTVFVEKSDQHHVLSKGATLQEDWASGAATVRELDSGEVLELLGEAKEVMQESRHVVKARAMHGGEVGWVCWSTNIKTIHPWRRLYTSKDVVTFTPELSDGQSAGSRKVKAETKVEALESPTVDASTGRLRVLCASAGEGVLGWATIHAEDGKTLLEPA